MFKGNRFRKTQNVSTQLSFESLEQRMMLSVVPPTVSDVNVSNTSWTPAFIDYLEVNGLGNDGYSIPVGSAAQSDSLSWLDLDRISITFSEDVKIQASDLSISGVTNSSYDVDHFSYDPQTLTATWTLGTPFAAEERVLLDLDGNGVDPVQDLDGNILDGEWTDEVSTYNSGNGTSGGDFEFRFNVLRGDIWASDDYIDWDDYEHGLRAQGNSLADPQYDPATDLDGDGLAEISDWVAIINHLWTSLPTGTPAGVADDAPTTTGFDLEFITDRVNDTRVSLHAVFDDLEDTDAAMTYTITSQSNSGLYDSITVDSVAGEIVLNPASSGSGRNSITITATDTNGLSVEAVLTSDLDYTNSPPVISNFTTTYLGGSVWEVSGAVSDSDDIVEGQIVQLSGLFNVRVVVAADGSFYYREIVLGYGGYVYATTWDQHGEESNTPFTFTGL